MQTQNIDRSNLFNNKNLNKIKKTPNIDRSNLINSDDLNKVKKKVRQSPNIDRSNLIDVKKILQYDKQIENNPVNPQMKKTSSFEKNRINPKILIKRNVFNDKYKFRNKFYDSKSELLSKKFNYIDADTKFKNTMMLLNKKIPISNDEINKIKFISFSEFKTKLFLSRINEDLSTKFFFSKNKDFLYKIINKLYFNKNVGKFNSSFSDSTDEKKKKLSPIKERIRNKIKYGGNILKSNANSFLSILSVLDRKHDFLEGTNKEITKYIYNEGTKYINNKIQPPSDQNNEMLELFKSTKNYEEDILINTIKHIMGENTYDTYFTNTNKLTSFAFIDITSTDTLEIYHKLLTTANETINITGADTTVVFRELIKAITTFYKYDITQHNFKEHYKYMFDTDVKLHSIFKTKTNKLHFHHNIYDKIGEQLYPFENAFDPHSSNDIKIDDTDIDLFRRIINTNFNYDQTSVNLHVNDNMYAIKKNVNKYLEFNVLKQQIGNNDYIPCIIFKKYDELKMLNFELYNNIRTANPTKFIIISPTAANGNIDHKYCKLSEQIGDSVLFYVDSTLIDTKCTYIKYNSPSFNNVPILKFYIKKLITILGSSNPHIEMTNLLKDIDDKKPSIVIIHYIIAYLYYCNDIDIININIINIRNCIKEIIEILFDLKKAGDWGQALFCSEYNKHQNVNRKDCFFVTGDKLAAVRSLLCTNVKTILPVDYTIISGAQSNKKKSILTLYRNKFALTFKDLSDYINNNLFTLKSFEVFKQHELKIEFLMTYNHYKAAIPNKNDLNITDAVFNKDTFNILINFLKYQMYIYLYMYTIVFIDETDCETHPSTKIDYDEYIDGTNTAKINVDRINAEVRDNYNDILNFDLEDVVIDRFYLLHFFRLKRYTLFDIQEQYLNAPNEATANAIIAGYTDIFNNRVTKLKNFLYTEETLKVVYRAFDKDFIDGVSSLTNSISDCQQKLINIDELYKIYSLLICDDKFINNGYDDNFITENRNENSTTAIKRVIDSTNEKITEFFDTFSTVYLNKAKFKKFTKEFITTKIVDLQNEKEEYNKIKDQLEYLEPYLGVGPNLDGSKLIIYFKSDIRGKGNGNDEFLDNINKHLVYYWTIYPDKDITKDIPYRPALNQEEKELLVYYNYFIESNLDELHRDLYDYYKIIYSHLFIGFDPSKIAPLTLPKKDDIIDRILNLYSNDYIKDINGYTKTMTFNLKETLEKIKRRLKKIEKSIRVCLHNINKVYSEQNTGSDLFDEELEEELEEEEPDGSNSSSSSHNSPVVGPAVVAPVVVGGVGTPPVSLPGSPSHYSPTNLGDTFMQNGNKRQAPAPEVEEPRSSRRSKLFNHIAMPVDSETKKNKIKELYYKLKGNREKFEYNPELFKEIIANIKPFASFLTHKVVPVQNRTLNKPADILGDIGFILYIIDFFENKIKNITSDIFKTMKIFFNDQNSELIKIIKKSRCDYYYNTDYIIIPIIYKYLKFIINNKEEFIFKKDKSIFQFKDIYKDKHKHKIDNILYNIDILFNIVKHTPLNERERQQALNSPIPGPGAPSSGRGRGRGTGRGTGRGAPGRGAPGRGAPPVAPGSGAPGRGAPVPGSSRGRGRPPGSGRGAPGRGAPGRGAPPVAPGSGAPGRGRGTGLG